MQTSGTTALARAKLNLCLHVTGQREDGYHLLDSLVVFPALGDRVEVEPSATLSLTLAGPFGLSLSAGEDNLVMLAARLMGGEASILLEKHLPVAAGLGGGSADAAAVIRLMEARGVEPPALEVLARIGADVPVCLASRPSRMRGIGDIVEDLPPLPEFWVCLANGGPMVGTRAVFEALERKEGTPLPALPEHFETSNSLFDYLSQTRNDLEAPAMRLVPKIGTVLDALRQSEGCALARMSGSGGTCFGLYAAEADALNAAEALRRAEPQWWVAAAAAF